MSTLEGMDERISAAGVAYEQAVFSGDHTGLAEAERSLDAVEADVALARGRLLHARFLRDGTEDPRELALFERAAELYQSTGDVRGEGEALFWIACVHQVIHGDHAKALPFLERSRACAVKAGDNLTLSYVLRHLGFVHHQEGRLDEAEATFEESTRLRRDLDFPAGVAANLVALAAIAADQGRRDDASQALDEAEQLAREAQAHAVRTWIDEARANLSL